MIFIPTIPTQADWQVKPVVEVREKFDRRLNRDLSPASNDDRTDIALRLRAGAEATYRKDTVVRVLLQYGLPRWSTAAGGGTTDYKDAIEANVATKLSDGRLVIGRQRVVKGDQRLLGLGEWGAKARAWDGLRYTEGPVDLFVGRLGVNAVQNKEARIAFGAYKGRWGETILINKTDTRPASSVQVWTLGNRYTKDFGRLSLQAEGAYQIGRLSNKNQRAFMASLRQAYKATPAITVYAQGDLVSGGSSATESRTFDLLYSTAVTSYGWLETQGGRNVRSYLVGAEWKPNKALSANLNWHSYDLYDRRDGWYGPGGGINARPGGTYVDPTGSSGVHVGAEVNLHVAWTVDRRSTVIFGGGVFNPGTFVSRQNGGVASRQKLGYVVYQFKF